MTSSSPLSLMRVTHCFPNSSLPYAETVDQVTPYLSDCSFLYTHSLRFAGVFCCKQDSGCFAVDLIFNQEHENKHRLPHGPPLSSALPCVSQHALRPYPQRCHLTEYTKTTSFHGNAITNRPFVCVGLHTLIS